MEPDKPSITVGSKPSICLNVSTNSINVPAKVSRSATLVPSFKFPVILKRSPKDAKRPAMAATPFASVPKSMLPSDFTARVMMFNATDNPIKPETFMPSAFFMNRESSRKRTPSMPSPFINPPVFIPAICLIATTRRLMLRAMDMKPVFPVNPFFAIRVKMAISVMMRPIPSIPFIAETVSIFDSKVIGRIIKEMAPAIMIKDFPSAAPFLNVREISDNSIPSAAITASDFIMLVVSIFDRTTIAATRIPIDVAIFRRVVPIESFFTLVILSPSFVRSFRLFPKSRNARPIFFIPFPIFLKLFPIVAKVLINRIILAMPIRPLIVFRILDQSMLPICLSMRPALSFRSEKNSGRMVVKKFEKNAFVFSHAD